jgi:hypothetical protein
MTGHYSRRNLMEGHPSRETMDIERRQTTDRRRIPTQPLSRFSLWGRRKRARRIGEDKNSYVDRYESRYFILICLVLTLCVLDAYFSLRIIDFGGEELNRLMFIFMYKKPISALVFKYLMTTISIVFFLMHKNFVVFGSIKVSHLIYLILSVYLVLVLYEAAVYFNHIRVLGL